MDSLLVEDKRKGSSQDDLRSSLCYYLSIILVLLAFIFSCISLGMCSRVLIKKSQYFKITPGTPVSIDRQGNAYPGAGTTIYRNITYEKINNPMKNIKVRELEHHMVLLVYHGGLTAMKGTYDTVQSSVKKINLPLTHDQQERKIDDIITLKDHTHFIIVGSKELLPLTVITTKTGNEVSVDFKFGTPAVVLNNDDMYPHVDKLTESTFAMIYENGNELYIRTGEWKGENEHVSLEVSEATLATLRYDFHGIAGIDANHFLIAGVGLQYNATIAIPGIRIAAVSVRDGKTTIGKWTWLPWITSSNFFDMDNLDDHRILMVFRDEMNKGISSVLILFDPVEETVRFGPNQQIQTGGAVTDYGQLDIRVLSNSTFAVFFEDQSIRGLTVVLCAVTPSNDIVITSPNYILNRDNSNKGLAGELYFDLCRSGYGNFIMAEYKKGSKHARVMIHKGIVLPRLLGVAQSTKKGMVAVQFAGMFYTSGQKKFTPGRAIFTNSKGELIEGKPIGYSNMNFGNFYEDSEDGNVILSPSNFVGMAVKPNMIYMKFR